MLRNSLIILLLLFTGCAQSFYSQGRKFIEQEKYDSAIDSFYKEIAANPKNAKAWRELGVAFYKKGNYIKGEDALKQANAINPDARTNLFLGLIYEKQNDYKKALDAYAASLNLNPGKQTKSMITAHLDRLLYKKVQNEIAVVIENENDINTDTIPENTVAVVNFDGSQLDEEISPIAVGLAEFTSSDLAKVNSLTVVERLKIDVILDELELGRTGYVDIATAPRLGRLIGAKKIITGSLLGIGEENLRLDGVIVGTTDSSTKFTDASEGKLKELFDIEKKLVFDVIDELGITLTQAERDAIEEVPTESYLAFLSYSRGLYLEQKGMPQAAHQEFNNAVKFDKNFQAAQSQSEKPIPPPGTPEAGYDKSLESLESFALSGSETDLTTEPGLDNRLVGVVHNAGVIPDESFHSPTDAQPRVSGTGKVIIRVNFDNE